MDERREPGAGAAAGADEDRLRTPAPPVYRAPAGRPVRASWLLAGGLFAATLTLISFFYTAQWYRAGAENRLLVAIAEEIADHHLEPSSPEVEAPTLDAVLAYFTGLGFRPVATPRLGGAGETLLGGRYCSIQGVPAAQLRYRTPGGSLVTRYEGTLPPGQLAALPDVGAGGRPFRHLVRGVDVSIWQERGLVFAEARPAGARAPRTGD
jgi:hypothetical protein